MSKVIFISIVFYLLYFFGNIAGKEMNLDCGKKEELNSKKATSLDVEKTFWCTAVTGEETADFLIYVAGKNGRYFMSTDEGVSSLSKNPSAEALGTLFSSNPSLFLADKSVKIDEVKCKESTLDEFLDYKKSQEIRPE